MEVLSLSGSSEDGTWRQAHQFPERIHGRLHPNKTEVSHQCICVMCGGFEMLHMEKTDVSSFIN